MPTLTGDLITPDGVLAGGALVVDDRGLIADILPRAQSLPRRVDIDAAGLLVMPGFLDMHVHGGGGADFMHGTPEAVRRVLRTHARFGTTGLLATTLTASRAEIDASIGAVCAVQTEGRAVDEARILGIHLEGPFICAHRRGAQPLGPIRPPDVEELRHWITLSQGQIRQLTIAPELPGAEAVVRAAAESGIIVSVGHTDATGAETLRAASWGARQGTHTFNAMRGLHHREPGTVGAILACPDFVAEVIADGVHLDPLVVRLVIAAKGLDGVVLVTDAMEAAAMPDGEYALGSSPVTVRNGTVAFADGTLAGSVLTMSQAVHNVQKFVGIGPGEASRLASANAARQLGLSGQRGELRVGAQADLAILHPETGRVEWTIIGGQVAYQR
jgi:N-acetylglucosamine-6-phosphate deacetylase